MNLPATSPLRLSIIILFVVATCEAFGQSQKKDTVKTDTIRNKYVPTGIRIGTDAISLVKSRTQNNFTGWEVNAEIDFSRYYLAIEHGTWGKNINSDSARYANDGRYWRLGVDVNFLRKDPDRNVFFIGARYGRSNFNEQLNLTSFDPLWGTLVNDYINADINARWIELTSGIRVKIWKVLWLGYTGRFKFALKTDATPEMLPHDVPGFGRTDKDTTWGFNYYVMIRLPLRKAPPVPVGKK